ncbi:MAG: hypothetical protein N2504_02880 [candidate division WOR-3 bacterium]|nr:hypothetical protein [candidate division WOR-3 bacterium]MCX7947516.1 hypothetical protein [candidate division WOR-3 bacterium]MDW8150402.1 hypothetical protein [candidate division WOR-3 bacterium]
MKLILIPIVSYLLATWVIFSLEKPKTCSIYIVIPIGIVILFSYLNEFMIKKAKAKFDKNTLALWSVSNLGLLYTAGSVLFTIFGGNPILSIAMLLIGLYDNYRNLKIIFYS